MRILTTGGAGFIGSNFARYMLNKYKDVEITNLDLLTYAGRLENLHDLSEDDRHKFVRGDIRDRATVASILRGNEIDAIVNFAAESHVDKSLVDAGEFVLTNAYGTYVLLDLARKYDTRRVIQVSTDEVYGSIEEGSYREDSPLNPSSLYSASKAGGDMISIACSKTYGLNVTITRSSNNYGAYQYPEKFVPKMILRALRNQPLPLYGNGRQIRDWLYVIDNCEAIDSVMERGKAGEIYNIAAKNERANIDVAKLILKILDKPESLISFVDDRPGHDRRYSIDATRIMSLGWTPKHTFEQGLKETIKWYMNNEIWWKPLLNDEFFVSDNPWKNRAR